MRHKTIMGGVNVKDSTRMLLNTLIGAVILCFTLVVFFIGLGSYEKNTLDYYALGFILFAEIIFISGLLVVPFRMKSTGMFSGVGIMTTLVAHLILTVISTLLFRIVFNDNTGAFLTTQFAFISLTAIIIIGFLLASSKTRTAAESGKDRSDTLRECESIAFAIKDKVSTHANLNIKNHYKIFSSLYEEFKYCDKTQAVSEQDQEIKNKVLELQSLVDGTSSETELDASKLSNMIADLKNMIKFRNHLVKQSK